MITYPLIRNKLCDTPTQKKYHRIPLAMFTLISKKNARKATHEPPCYLLKNVVQLDTSRSTTKGR